MGEDNGIPVFYQEHHTDGQDKVIEDIVPDDGSLSLIC